MILTVDAYTEPDAAGWDDFVRERSRNGIIFHERQFLGYHPSDRFADRSLIFRQGQHVHGVLPAA